MALKIMVVDDEPSVSRLMRVVLEKEGYDVVIAASGTEALLKVNTEKWGTT